MLLGCVADDLTGATDMALMLARGGLRTVQTTGVPTEPLDLSSFDAVVVALKSRTIPAPEAVDLSLRAAMFLKEAGAKRYFFKYCSTFDSTDQGNIGPVTEALLRFTASDFTIACPAFPANGRTIYFGHLFVNGVPLHESSMKDHPLTPMRDSNLVRVLQRQTALAIGLIDYRDVEGGAPVIDSAIARERAAGKSIGIVDALSDSHLREIGAAVAGLPLVTGGSGVALGLPAAYRNLNLIDRLTPPVGKLHVAGGRMAILVGSCSVATRGQVAAAIAAGIPSLQIDPVGIAEGRIAPNEVVNWIDKQAENATPMVYSSADPDTVRAAQGRLGLERAGQLIEQLLAKVAKSMVGHGFTRLIVAGGETSGAVVEALGVQALAIGPEIDPGVPWTRSIAGTDLALALKSGNFGAPDFFLKAWRRLD